MIREIWEEVMFRLEVCAWSLMTAVLVLICPGKVMKWLEEWKVDDECE